MDTHAAVYVSESDPRPLFVRGARSTLAEIGAVVAARGFALVAPHRPARPGAPAWVLTPAEIQAHRPLRQMAAGLAPDLRLVVVIWPDGAGIIAAVPRGIGPPPAAWLRQAHRTAAAFPACAAPAWWPSQRAQQ
jgi:hypothetical protein